MRHHPKKKARRGLTYDENEEETVIWENKEKSKKKGIFSCCWSETDSVDEMMARYVELEKKIEKQELGQPEPEPGCSTWESPEQPRKWPLAKKTNKPKMSTQEINDLQKVVLIHQDMWDEMKKNLPGFFDCPTRF